MITWTIFTDEAARVYGPSTTAGDLLGFLPEILRPEDPRPAKEQIAERYAHGGGWRPFGRDEWKLSAFVLKYPGDPEMKPIAALALPHSKEMVVLYPHQMVAVLRPEGDFDVVRLD
ncbi:MAG TPA: hypothetical protein VN524_04825 [Hyphomicrobiaceae bacterium]|nr:hypothetical protein [Hyphomicrobiaceae bacterium]